MGINQWVKIFTQVNTKFSLAFVNTFSKPPKKTIEKHAKKHAKKHDSKDATMTKDVLNLPRIVMGAKSANAPLTQSYDKGPVTPLIELTIGEKGPRALPPALVLCVCLTMCDDIIYQGG